jgi:hypothetical protein
VRQSVSRTNLSTIVLLRARVDGHGSRASSITFCSLLRSCSLANCKRAANWNSSNEVDVTESEKAQQALAALTSAETAAPDAALQILNGLIGLVQSEGGDQSIEVDEARAGAFLAICEVGKALHRRQPVGPLWAAAIAAAQHWTSLAR